MNRCRVQTWILKIRLGEIVLMESSQLVKRKKRKEQRKRVKRERKQKRDYRKHKSKTEGTGAARG
ncbi:hypothetical protein ALC56_07041 [Trachymyrmex septentrionalis]|uniref:Uncharacterized protein n=1 Tax=Trachymyrmex septentrionalis TaxID=34720 RepID=A0A195FDS4_9HYME|nr:hypothetical protein ALC56_07041 [Trachymyrmex septentrionalis]